MHTHHAATRVRRYEAVLCGPRSKGQTPLITAGHEGIIRLVEGGALVAERRAGLGRLSALAFSKSDRLLLCGSAAGTVRAYSYPLDATSEGASEDCAVHAGLVSCVQLSHCESYLFSGACVHVPMPMRQPT